MMNNKIIFLDIDGVLNPTHYNTALFKLWKASFNEIKNRDKFGDLFFYHNVDALKYIIDETVADIVISSTWRTDGLDVMKALWKFRNLPGKVIDITPNEIDVVNAGITEFYDMVSRGQEIDLWIKNNNFKGNYCIIDDVKDFYKHQDALLIKTDSNVGLTFKNANKAIEILNKK